MPTTRGYGIAGSLDHGVVEKVAAAVEEAGFASFWANDTPGGDGLASLAAAARDTDNVDLGVGVIPVDRTKPEQLCLLDRFPLRETSSCEAADVGDEDQPLKHSGAGERDKAHSCGNGERHAAHPKPEDAFLDEMRARYHVLYEGEDELLLELGRPK